MDLPPLRMTALVLLAALLALAPAAAQTLEVRPDTGRVTVGDPVALRLILRQYEGDALLEQVPHPQAALADGVRLLDVDSMRRIGDRLLEAHARIAFYRPGPQTIPVFAIDFRRGAVILHGTMRSEPVPIEIAAVLTEGGGSTLRDIRELVEALGPDPRKVAAIAAALAVTVWALRRRRGRAALVPVPALATVDVAPAAPDPFAVALDRLAEIERAGWASSGDVAAHYQAVTDALRDYLEVAADVPARERTTAELRWSLPPALRDGRRGRGFDPLFDEADLVKFARRRPTTGNAAAFLGDARALLEDWREAISHGAISSGATEAADAFR
ncbi:MAG: hypothetical protein ABJC36_00495 [Gemmatimonadales bacterium]